MERNKAEATKWLENATTLRDEARFRSVQGKDAGSWLSAIPASREFVLSSCKLCLAALLRLGLPLPYSDNIQICNCGKSMTDTSSYRQITYKTGGEPV